MLAFLLCFLFLLDIYPFGYRVFLQQLLAMPLSQKVISLKCISTASVQHLNYPLSPPAMFKLTDNAARFNWFIITYSSFFGNVSQNR